MQQIWEFIAGLGLFLFAMYLMETSLKGLAGRKFKLFLRRNTDKPIKAIVSSTIITTLLQSSSVVIMIVLSFVGAGIVKMRNALAVTLGSNIGTTLANWIIVFVGFKMEISMVALPLVAAGSVLMAFSNDVKKIQNSAMLLLGFGFLFLGLDFMKESMTVVLENFDFTRFENYPPVVFVLIGFVMTGLIQSSSATVAILLSALSTNAIPFEPAVAAVIGSEMGTALKVVIGSINGVAAKRQLAVGNFTFNVVITIMALLLIKPLIASTTLIFKEDEILLRLVMFQTTMNIMGVLLFIPLLNWCASLLEKHVKGKERPASFVIDQKILNIPAIATDALEQDTHLLLHRVLHLNLEAFATERKIIHSDKAIDETIGARNKKLNGYEKKYEDLKKSEGEILIYALKLSDHAPDFNKRNETLVKAIRHAMHSAKAMKDVFHNRVEFHETADDSKFVHYIDFRRQLEAYYEKVNEGLQDKSHSFEGLVNTALNAYNERRAKIYEAAKAEKLNAEDVSSLLNVNRELYTSCKTIVQALQLFYESKTTEKIGEIP